MKKLLSAFLAVLMLFTLCISAGAAMNSEILHTYYSFDGDRLMALGAELPSKGTATITLASQENLDVEQTTIAATGLGTTVYCVVDTSSAMPKQAMEYATEILTKISASMGKEDRMVITTVGDAISESAPLTSPDARKNAIAKLKFDSKSTDLYQAVSFALDSLATKTDYNFNKCLVVLSDGKDDGRTSVTEETVLSKIEKSTVPVFGVGLMQEYPSDYVRSLTNTLERMSEASVGGTFYETSNQGTHAKDIASGIWTEMQNASVFFVDTTGLNRSKLGDTILLTVRYDTEDAIYEDSISILTSDLPAAKPVQNAPQAPVTAAPDPVETEKTSPVMLIAIIAAVLLVIAAIVIIVVVKKKAARKRAASMAVQQDEVSATTPVVPDSPADIPAPPCDEVREFGGVSVLPVPQVPAGPQLKLRLTVIGHGDQFFEFTMAENQPTVLGRDDRADIALMIGGEADPKLSGKHCTMQWTDGRLFVADNNSTNGTFVNGSQVIPGSLQVLESGSLLRIGCREYRISFEA